MKYLIFALLRSHKSEKCIMDLNLVMTGVCPFVCELKIQIRFLCNYDREKSCSLLDMEKSSALAAKRN